MHVSTIVVSHSQLYSSAILPREAARAANFDTTTASNPFLSKFVCNIYIRGTYTPSMRVRIKGNRVNSKQSRSAV